MGASTNRLAITGILTSLIASTRAAAPIQFPFSNSTTGVGPDGPWNYLTVSVGQNPTQEVDYHMELGVFSSLTMAKRDCSSSPCISPTPRYYDTTKGSGQTFSGAALNLSAFPSADSVSGFSGSGFHWIDDFHTPSTASNISLFVATSGTITVHGDTGYVPLSYMSLESGNQTQPTVARTTSLDFSPLNTFVRSKGISQSFGLHIGSPTFNQPGSLHFGGYDQSRLIEPPAKFTAFGSVPLQSVSFGTARGLSPWQGSTTPLPSNFLTSSINPLISPQVSYLELPPALCSFMADYLPITFNSDFNLYVWNTNSPQYQEIISSPSYLNFTFGDSKRTSIRVPFALLNLTLTSPLVSSPTQYFPCYPRSDSIFRLGRAFLQSAFLAQSYDATYIILAQAPGPLGANSSTSISPQTFPVGNPTATTGNNPMVWADSWANVLTPLASVSATVTASPMTGTAGSTAGISGGAIAGIVIGALAALALVAALVFVLLRRRRAARARYTGLANGGKPMYADGNAIGLSSRTGSPAYAARADRYGHEPKLGAGVGSDGRAYKGAYAPLDQGAHEAGGTVVNPSAAELGAGTQFSELPAQRGVHNARGLMSPVELGHS